MRRVAIVFRTEWDGKQLEQCRDSWESEFELLWPEPSDLDCDADLDPVAWVGRTAALLRGGADGVLSASDYPGATLAGALAQELGLPGTPPEKVIGCSHKYRSRLIQREVAPEAVPGFALVDPDAADLGELPLPFPVFVKPNKGAFSIHSRRVDSAAELVGLLATDAVREFRTDYMDLFERMRRGYTDFAEPGGWFLAEELLHGEMVTVEGYALGNEVHVLGIVDSSLQPVTKSFVRFDYPSSLPAAVQERMGELVRRVIGGLGLRDTFFNAELMYDADAERLWIVEINPRICGQFGDLYQKVDGVNSYRMALDVAVGEGPVFRRGGGAFRAAASIPLRVFEPCRVARAPDPETVRAVREREPDVLFWSECASGDVLADFARVEDGASQRYGILNLGGADRQAIDARAAAILAALDYRFEPVPGAPSPASG